MRSLIIIFTACIFLAANNIILTSSVNVTEAFEDSQIVPDVTPCAPRCTLQVVYPDDVFVDLGNMLDSSEVVDPPSIYFSCDDLSYYTLALIDPDVPLPTNTSRSQIRHWIVGNIPGDDADVHKGETLADYISPAPIAGSGAHRYVFLLYQQPGYIKFNETRLNATVTPERFVHITEFVEKYDLGCPVFGNFFLAEIDEDTLESE